MQDNTFNIKSYLQQFSPLELFFWLQTVLIHPNNQKYNCRLEYLVGLFLSIPKNEFGNKKPTHKDVQLLFEYSDEELTKLFFSYEDFDGFDQSKLVPLFVSGNSYNVFYGSLERPIEDYQKLIDLYFIETDIEILNRFRNDLMESLYFQSKLLKLIISHSEHEIRTEKVYVPTLDFYNQVSQYFRFFKGEYFTDFEPVKFGDFEKISNETLISKVMNGTTFKSPYLEYNNQYYFFLPHFHYLIFCYQGNALVKSNSKVRELAFKNFKERLFDTCTKFFHFHKHIPAIFLNQVHVNLLEGRIDFAVWIGEKLCLFKCVPHSTDENINTNLEQTIHKLAKVKNLIKKQDIIGVADIAEEKVNGFYTKEIDILLFPVAESTTLNLLAATNEGDESVFIFSYMDLKAVFEKLEKPFVFLKFLKEEKALLGKNQFGFMGEFMDRFIFYVQNNNSFSRSGVVMSHIFFVFHQWSEYYMNERYEKHQDNAYAIIEKKAPNYFNYQEQYKPNIYRAVETAYLSGTYLVRLEDRDIWVYTPTNGFNLDEKYMSFGFELLSTLFADYIEKLGNSFDELLQEVEISRYHNYSIHVIPDFRVSKNKHFKKIYSSNVHLNQEKPIEILTNTFNGRNIVTTVVYNPDYAMPLFESDSNVGERFCLTKLVESILLFGDKKESDAKEIAKNYIDKQITKTKKRYSSGILRVDNPKLDKYQQPIEINETEVHIVNRQLSEYFIKEQYERKEYEDKEALELNYNVYCFLQKNLEDKLKEYGTNALKYAYWQLELIKGQRRMNKLKFGMQSEQELDYDLLESIQDINENNIKLSAIVKHIIHSILKTNSTGTENKAMSKDIWTEFLAIGAVLIDTVLIYEYIQFDVKKHTILINDNYVLEDKKGESIIEDVNYQLEKAKISLEISNKAYHNSRKEPVQTNTETNNDFFEEMKDLDDAFLKQYDFKYTDLLTLLMAINVSSFSSSNYSPISIISLKTIQNELSKNPTLQSKETIKKIMNFLSLSNGIYGINDLLIPSNMMRNKERINVCPFIKLDKTAFIIGNEVAYNSFKFWSNVAIGDFPFDLKKKNPLFKIEEKYHKKVDKQLEIDAENIAVETLGQQYVEARVLNFRRLSQNFVRQPSCGEIDLLCINPNTKTVFVLDAKNINKKSSLYYLKKNIKEFFYGKKPYFNKLVKKTTFVQDNLHEILKHFKIEDTEGWKLKQAFIANEIYFAAFYKEVKVDFVRLKQLSEYLEK